MIVLFSRYPANPASHLLSRRQCSSIHSPIPSPFPRVFPPMRHIIIAVGSSSSICAMSSGKGGRRSTSKHFNDVPNGTIQVANRAWEMLSSSPQKLTAQNGRKRLFLQSSQVWMAWRGSVRSASPVGKYFREMSASWFYWNQLTDGIFRQNLRNFDKILPRTLLRQFDFD